MRDDAQTTLRIPHIVVMFLPRKDRGRLLMNQQKYFLKSKSNRCLLAIAAFVFSASFQPALAQSLGSAASFGVLGATTVTNTGATVVTGNVGVSPGSAITGFPPGVATALYSGAGSLAGPAQADAHTAYTNITNPAAFPCTRNLSGQDLGTVGPLTPGVYCFDSSAQLTGTLVLDAQNNPNAVFIFRIGSTLTTATASSVVVINGVPGCSGTNNNIYFAVGSSATLGTGTQFAGNILAVASITLTTGASLAGRAIALGGAVTLDTNTVNTCAGTVIPSPSSCAIKVTGGGQIPVPSPDSNDPSATGTGRATFGFNAQPERNSESCTAAKGHFNYLNHVTGLHVNGPVNDVSVIATNPDGSPQTVRFSGTCDGSSPQCSFSVTVQDNGEPGTSDQFGITVTGALSEVRSQRVISRGNIQFH